MPKLDLTLISVIIGILAGLVTIVTAVSQIGRSRRRHVELEELLERQQKIDSKRARLGVAASLAGPVGGGALVAAALADHSDHADTASSSGDLGDIASSAGPDEIHGMFNVFAGIKDFLFH